MEALFAEMRKAQTGGVDFAAEAAEKRRRDEEAERRARRGERSDDDSDDSDSDDGDVDESRGERPRGLAPADERRLLSMSQAGREREEREERGGGGGGGHPASADPATEAARHRAVSALAAKFEATCGHALGGRWWSHFESWLYARRAAATTTKKKKMKGGGYSRRDDADPVIPDPELARHDPDLHRKLTASGMSEYDATGAGMAMQRAAAAAIAQVAREAPGASSLEKKKVKLAEFAVGATAGGDTAGGTKQPMKVRLTCGKVSVEVNDVHLRRLRAAFQRFAPSNLRRREGAFRSAAFACLARYSSAQGAHYKAGGMQASIPPSMHDALRAHFGVGLELCASPLNARYRRFCSAYLDVDEVFGSMGDCLKFEPDAGSFEVNPPFDPVFMGAVCGHMERLLANASGAMSFAVIVPCRPNDASWSRLVNSVYARERIEFKAGSHAYVAGGQHVRSARATPSAAATTLVLLQNESGARKWPATREAIAAVRAGFAEGTKRSADDDADGDGDDAAGKDSDGDGSGDSDATDDDGFDARGARRRAAGSGGGTAGAGGGAVWDFGDVRRLFWGAGSAGRWGKRPAGWVVENVAECIEDHWVGDDPEDGEDEEGDEEDDDDEGGDEDEDVSGSDSGDEDDDEDEDEDDSDLDLEEGDEYGSEEEEEEDEEGEEEEEEESQEDLESSDEESESESDEAPPPGKKVRRA